MLFLGSQVVIQLDYALAGQEENSQLVSLMSSFVQLFLRVMFSVW